MRTLSTPGGINITTGFPIMAASSAMLEPIDVEGDFETHLTVGNNDLEQAAALQNWANRRGLKFHHIVLDRGFTPSQPMITQFGTGAFSTQLSLGRSLAAELASRGFRVSRLKIEAAPDNRGVPETDRDGENQPTRYFEHHVKLVLEPAADMASLTDLVAGRGARLSRNARRIRVDGRSERFVTQRCRLVGRKTAHDRLLALLAAIRIGGYPIQEVEEEFVVYDSDPGVDAGWLELGGAQ